MDLLHADLDMVPKLIWFKMSSIYPSALVDDMHETVYYSYFILYNIFS